LQNALRTSAAGTAVSGIDGVDVDDNSRNFTNNVLPGRIGVQRRPAPEYRKHVVVCRADDIAIGILSSKIRDDLVEANFARA
jgi:hypothetical protein